MLKRNKLFLVYTTLFLFITTGCQSATSEQVEIQMKSIEEQKHMLDHYTFEDYKKVFDEAVSEAKTFDSDDQLQKWLIRTLAEEKLYYETDLTDEQVLTQSTKALEEDRLWKTVAQEEYDITVTEEEVTAYIDEGPNTSDLPQHLAYASALGLSLEELNYDFDRDIYTKNAMWLKLKPKLEKKYKTSDNNMLVEKYEEEVKEQLH